MTRTKKKETDPVSDIVKSISYGTGLIVAKVKNLGKAAQSKDWKEAVSKTQSIVQNVGKSVQDNLTEMKESFDEGVKSIAEDEDGTQEEKEEIIVPAKEPLSQEEKVEVAEAQVAPLPNEIAPAKHEIIEEELMDEEEAPKPKEVRAQSKKKIAKPVTENTDVSMYTSIFTLDEFNKEGKNPQDLVDAIRKNKSEIVIEATDPIVWLNELITQGVSGLPLQYKFSDTAEIKAAREAYEGAGEDNKTQSMIKLNRLILEEAYQLKCPKLASEEPKPKSRRSKKTDGEVNLN